jgi:hypothetical protein
MSDNTLGFLVFQGIKAAAAPAAARLAVLDAIDGSLPIFARQPMSALRFPPLSSPLCLVQLYKTTRTPSES